MKTISVEQAQIVATITQCFIGSDSEGCFYFEKEPYLDEGAIWQPNDGDLSACLFRVDTAEPLLVRPKNEE